MGANAGGANVGGVQATEQGTLAMIVTPSAFSVAGGEINTIDVTVPAGHIWVLKNISYSVNTFVGTLSYVYAKINIGGSLAILSTTLNSNQFNSSIPLTLVAGQKIEYKLSTSAWTSGQIYLTALYQDILTG